MRRVSRGKEHYLASPSGYAVSIQENLFTRWIQAQARSPGLCEVSLKDDSGRVYCVAIEVLTSEARYVLRGYGTEPMRAETAGVNAECVDLSSLEVNDAVLRALTHLPKLRRLYLRNVPVTDETADRLAGLSNLRVIDLSGAQISREAFSRLSAALPKCRIIREEMPSTTARAAMRQCLVAEAIRRLLSPH